jgi:hypothetical protein
MVLEDQREPRKDRNEYLPQISQFNHFNNLVELQDIQSQISEECMINVQQENMMEDESISGNILFEQLQEMSAEELSGQQQSSKIHKLEKFYDQNSTNYQVRSKRSYKKKNNKYPKVVSKKSKKIFVCDKEIGKDKRTGEPILCMKKFNERGNLQVHQRIHSGERPYECQFCPK